MVKLLTPPQHVPLEKLAYDPHRNAMKGASMPHPINTIPRISIAGLSPDAAQ